jgi:hypothetical protein
MEVFRAMERRPDDEEWQNTLGDVHAELHRIHTILLRALATPEAEGGSP